MKSITRAVSISKQYSTKHDLESMGTCKVFDKDHTSTYLTSHNDTMPSAFTPTT